MKSLQQLIDEIRPWILRMPKDNLTGIEVSALTENATQTNEGSFYVALKGSRFDGHDFIHEAIGRGVCAVVGERELAEPVGVRYFQVSDSRSVLALLAAAFFDHPSRQMRMYGITGTSGKTTTTYLLESVLKAAGCRTGVIGTINFRFEDHVIEATHTTPGPVEFNRLLHQMCQWGCTDVVMEVSSHALKQRRIFGTVFDGMLFTNLSHEHLDYHTDMNDYFESKALLFGEYLNASIVAGKTPCACVNRDDPYGQKLIERIRGEFGKSVRLFCFGTRDDCEFSGLDLRFEINGIHGSVAGVSVDSRLVGHFNGMNLLATIALARGTGIEPEAIASGIRDLAGVPGRLESVSTGQDYHVFVDYAHKPEALREVLTTLRELVHASGRLITVLGCGGDRDASKRPLMAEIACRQSDHAIFTSDNPRSEDPNKIIQDMLKGTSGRQNFEILPDRRSAIAKAIDLATVGDVVLIAGKGHETYQLVGKSKIHFDDREVAKEEIVSKIKTL